VAFLQDELEAIGVDNHAMFAGELKHDAKVVIVPLSV
jgi:hypothetical protein